MPNPTSSPAGFIRIRKFLVYKLLYTEEAKKEISKIKDSHLKLKIQEAAEEIAKDPAIGKALTRELKGRYSYRVSDYRMIYRIYHDQVIVLILTVGHRREVYSKSARKSW